MSKYPGRIVTDLAPAGYSVYFDGSNDRLIIANTSSAFPTGTQEFTLEFWAYKLNAWNTNDQFLFQDSATAGLQVWVNTAGGIFRVGSLGVAGIVDYAYSNLSINTWTHFAISRKVNSWALWVNGTRVATATYSSGLSSAVGTQTIGGASGSASWNGYISNVRIVRGTTVYDPASTTINVPTQLFVVPSTTLLTCNSPAIVDQSNNAFAITVNDNAAVSTLTPFTAYVPYNPALGASTPGVWTVDEAMQAAATRQWNMYDPSFNLTTLLLHGNGTNGAQNNTFLDSSSNNFTITRNGNATQGSFSPFSQTGWSNHFGSSTSNLKFASDAAFAVGNSNFTVECFVNFTAWASTNQRIFVQGQSGTDNLTIQRDSGANNLVVNIQGSSSISYAWSPNIGQWYHIAVVKSGTGTGQVAVYIDGVSVATGTSSTSISQNQVLIGGIDWASGYNMQGYISNLRYTIGAALYTGNFTPTTSALTTTSQGATASQVEILTCQSNRFVDNSSNGFAITINGTPSVQPFSPFYPTIAYTTATVGGSGYFDGTGDYVQAANASAFNVSNNNFCLETWVYFTSAQTTAEILGQSNVSFGSGSYHLWLNTSGYIAFYCTTGGTTATRTDLADTNLRPVNAWTHVVACRTGNTLSLFVNGSRVATTTFTGTIFNDTTNGFAFGAQPGGGANITGYLSASRLVNGSNPYDATLTTLAVPTAPPTPITNTSILLNYTNAGIIDSAGDNVLETVGDAQISTTQSKFGGSSMYFDGTGDSLLLPSSPIRALGTADFTIEFWFNASSIPTFAAIIDMRNPNTDNIGFDIMFYFNKLAFGTATFTYITGVTTLSTGTWYHYALTRSGNVFRQFLNGVQEGSTYTGSSTQNFTNTILRIGNGSNGPYTGYLDDIRITRGYARYTGNFTPQTSQWQDQ